MSRDGRLSIFSGHQGRVSTCANKRSPSAFLAVRNSGTSFSVCGTALWTGHRTKSLYKGSGSSYGPFEIQGHTCCPLPQRHFVGQCHSGGIHQSPRRDSKRSGHGRSVSYHEVGRGTCSSPIGWLHFRRGELGGRLSQSDNSRSWGVVPSPSDIQSDRCQMGILGRRSDGVQAQQQSPGVHGTVEGPPGLCGGRSRGSMGSVSSPVYLSAHSVALQGTQTCQGRGNSDHSGGSRLSSPSMVRRDHVSIGRRPLSAAAQKRSSKSGSALPPEFRVASFDGLAVETSLLKERGFSPEVIHTIVNVRNISSSRIYYQVWRAFFAWCESRRLHPLRFSLPRIIDFLQSGLDLGLSLSSLRGQVSVLLVLFNRALASKRDSRTFIQGVAHRVPPYHLPIPVWDLNLVLEVLQVSPFEPLQDISPRLLSWKVALLVAITSIRRVSELASLSHKPPFLAFHQDKVVLRPVPSFLAKVVSVFHLKEDIVLPSFCPAPKHRREVALHNLDVDLSYSD
ncbi:hypothetical protein PRIEUP_LOCUS18265 [Pristimantis euphronides]